MALGPSFKDIVATDIDDGAISDASHTTPSAKALDDLLVTEHRTFGQILQLVPNLSCSFADFPSLEVDGVPEVAIQLDQSLHDELTAPNYIEGESILPDIIDSGPFGHFQLVRDVIEIESILSLPLSEEWMPLQIAQSGHSFIVLVLL